MTQLDDYISKARVAGLDDEAIKNELRKAGWDEGTISANFQLPQTTPSVVAGSMPDSLPAQFREHFAKPSIWRKIRIPVISACLLMAVGAGAYFGYNYYFNSNDNLLADALQKTFTANSGHMSFQMSVADKIEKGDDMNDLSQIFGDNLAVNIKGDADYKLSTKKTMDVDGDFEASFNVGGFNVGVNVSVKVIGEDTYVHLGDNPLLQMFTGLDSSESSKWFKLNTKELEALAEEGNNAPVNESAINKIQNLFQKGEFISLGKNLGSEKVGDTNSTHYQLIINKDNLKKTIGEMVELFATDSGAPSGEAQEAVQVVSLFIDKADITADIWISSDKYVRKLVYDFKLPSLTQVTEIYDEAYGDVEEPDFQKALPKIKSAIDQSSNTFVIKFTGNYSDFGKEVKIEAPTDFVDLLDNLEQSRSKSRDAKRVADIKQIQTALELYYGDNMKYPVGNNLILGSTAAGSILLDGFHSVGVTVGGVPTITYMNVVPSNPTPGGSDYIYTQTDNGKSYTINFTLETDTAGINAGSHTASPDGIK